MRRGRLRRRGDAVTATPAALWYPAGAAAHEAATRAATEAAARELAPLDRPVPGTLVLEERHGLTESTFRPAGGRLVPVVAANGALFLSWAASPGLLGRPVADTGLVLEAFLVLPPELPERTRERIRAEGWRLGRPRPA